MTKFISSLKKALLKKQAAQHPDAKPDENKPQATKTPVLPNRPTKKATGRGR